MRQNYKMDNSRRAKQFAPFAALSGQEEYLQAAEEEHFQLPNNQARISTIVSINAEGKILPLYFSYNGCKFQIYELIWSLEKVAWNQYRCAIIDQEKRKIVDLFFYKELTLWTLTIN